MEHGGTCCCREDKEETCWEGTRYLYHSSIYCFGLLYLDVSFLPFLCCFDRVAFISYPCGSSSSFSQSESLYLSE